VFEDGGVLGDIILGELPLLFLPLEQDLLSLELENSFKELYFVSSLNTFILRIKDGDLSSISASAQALMQLQSTQGLFPRLTGKGDKAKILADMLLRMRQETIIDGRSVMHGVGQSQSIESLIIIDREVDFITPLLTQLTYEGLIDEKFGIKNSLRPSFYHSDFLALVELDTSLTSPPSNNPTTSSSTAPLPPAPRTRKQALNSSDPLYASLRDVNFAIVGTVLNRVARRLSDDYEVIYSCTTSRLTNRGVIKLKLFHRSKNSLAN
jgi:vacuolar protein sorting-associated protein 33A